MKPNVSPIIETPFMIMDPECARELLKAAMQKYGTVPPRNKSTNSDRPKPKKPKGKGEK